MLPLSVSTSIAMWRLRLAGCWCGLVSVVMVITSEPSAGVRGATWLSGASSCPAYAENTRLTGHSLCSTQCTMCCSLTCRAWSCTVQMSSLKPLVNLSYIFVVVAIWGILLRLQGPIDLMWWGRCLKPNKYHGKYSHNFIVLLVFLKMYWKCS